MDLERDRGIKEERKRGEKSPRRKESGKKGIEERNCGKK